MTETSAGFSGDQNQEVLYENTGLSRHFPVHFGRDTLQCRSIEDFEALSGAGDNTERRRHRVYQQLALSPGVYCSPENQSDYEYVKNQRRAIGASLDEALDGELQIHRNGAFFLLSEGERCGMVYPGTRALSDAALLLCAPAPGPDPQRRLPPPGGRYRGAEPAGVPLRDRGVPGQSGETAGDPRSAPCRWIGWCRS